MDFYVGHGIFFGVIHGIFLLDFFFFLVEFWNEYFGTWYFVRMSILGHGVLWASR